MSIAEKLTIIAENMQDVYDKGYADGKASGGGGEGDNYYDTFWDSFQDNGAKTDYGSAFRFGGWNDVTFKPKYKMYPSDATYMFGRSSITDGNVIAEYVDFSNCVNVNGCFTRSKFTSLPVLDFTSVTTGGNIFTAMIQLESIEKIIINPDGSFPFNTSSEFNSCTRLKEVRYEGVIGISFYAQFSPLSVASMTNIISCLKNYAGTSEEGKYTVKFSSSCWTALEASGTAPDGNTWKDYVEIGLGWLT